MKCIYIGQDFYFKSGTQISSVYKIVKDGLERTDWGFIQMALENGESINIRPATKYELSLFENKLKKLKEAN